MQIHKSSTDITLLRIMPYRNILELKFVSVDTTSYDSAKEEVERMGFLWEDWYYDRAVKPDSVVKDINFWKQVGDNYIDDVPVCKIIGQNHQAYDCHKGLDGEPRWITYFYSVSDKWKKTDPSEVLDDIVRLNNGPSPVVLAKYDEDYFLLEGQHRTVHAKFLKMDSMRCRVINYQLDSESLALYNRLKDIIGPKPLNGLIRFVDIDSISFTWHGISFALRWNKETIDAFEEQVSQAMRINKNKVYKTLFLVFNNSDGKKYRRFSLDNSSQIPDFRAALLSVINE